MVFPAKEIIQMRKSVRSFDGTPLRAADRQALEELIQDVPNPFGIPVHFRLLDAKEYHLSSPVVVGTELYLAAKVERSALGEIGFGYSFEKVCLTALSMGIGSVFLATSLSRQAFEEAMKVGPGEVLPAASPLGYPALHPSVRDGLMRKGFRAEERLPFEQLFFDGGFDRGLFPKQAGIYAEAFEMVRWAPSAANRQPWRVLVEGDRVHFFLKRSIRESPVGDVQRVDLGIALCHFDLTMQEEGHRGRFVRTDPDLARPGQMEYIATYERETGC